ncbi:hypothetical protein LXL04_028279 [Taraxacum kok-saghyz]
MLAGLSKTRFGSVLGENRNPNRPGRFSGFRTRCRRFLVAAVRRLLLACCGATIAEVQASCCGATIGESRNHVLWIQLKTSRLLNFCKEKNDCWGVSFNAITFRSTSGSPSLSTASRRSEPPTSGTASEQV